MLQSHAPDRFRDALGFILFQRKRLRGADRAKAAGTRATFARDHHGRGALAPAFPAVRALRALADGVQPQIGNQRFGRKENRVDGSRTLIQGGFCAWCSAGSILAQDIGKHEDVTCDD